MKQKERSKALLTLTVDMNSAETGKCVQLFHVLIFDLIPFLNIFQKRSSLPPPPLPQNLKRSRLRYIFIWSEKERNRTA